LEPDERLERVVEPGCQDVAQRRLADTSPKA
jgi:hypothetical protein